MIGSARGAVRVGVVLACVALAAVPAILAVPLFWGTHRRTPFWWLGVVVFALFLPNAPYVVTDIIHLRLDAAQ